MKEKSLIWALAALLAVGTAWLMLGCYRTREWREPRLFLKHRPSVQFVFTSPLGDADRSPTPGHEGYLDAAGEREEEAYVEFVEVHGGERRSIPLPL